MWKLHSADGIAFVLVIVFLVAACRQGQEAQQPGEKGWAVHDEKRPLPPVVQPGTTGSQERPGKAPSDAVVLFDGTGLSAWSMENGEPAKWKFLGDCFEVVEKTGTMVSKPSFGDCQLHIEWASPSTVKGSGQGRGNSGVFLMGLYEVQVLDSYDNITYADGQAASIYGQYPPLVNASLPPGQWQTYDILFHRPRFDETGGLLSPACMTILHNGILVQYNAELTGPTAYKARPPYKAHADKLPLALQDHGNPVRYRNIWVRPLE